MKTWLLSVLVLLSCSYHSDASEKEFAVQPVAGPRFLDVPVSTDHVTSADRSSMELHKVNSTSVEWVIPIKVDLTALKQDTIEAFLFDRHVVIRRKPAWRPPTGNVVHWHGEVALPGDVDGTDHMGLRDVDIFIRNGTVSAYIRINEIVYSLSSTSRGTYFLIKQDGTKLNHGDDVFAPEDGPEGGKPSGASWIPPITPGPEPEPEPLPSPRTVRLIIGFTSAATRGNPQVFYNEVYDYIQFGTNTFWGSGIPLSLEVAAFAQPGYTESSIQRTLSDLRTTDGPLWLLHTARHHSYGDVMVMIVEGNYSWPCGGTHNVGSTRQTAYMVVRRDCLSQGTLVHELAHLLGAHHNPENVGALAPKYVFGHGYWRDSEPHSGVRGFSTIMTSPEACLYGCPRVLRFSSPTGWHNDWPTGSSVHDNVRAILLDYRSVANFYPDPPRSSSAMKALHTPQGIKWLPAF